MAKHPKKALSEGAKDGRQRDRNTPQVTGWRGWESSFVCLLLGSLPTSGITRWAGAHTSQSGPASRPGGTDCLLGLRSAWHPRIKPQMTVLTQQRPHGFQVTADRREAKRGPRLSLVTLAVQTLPLQAVKCWTEVKQML